MQHTHSYTGEVASGGTGAKAEGSGRWQTLHKQKWRVLPVSEADELSQSQTIFHLSTYVERHQLSLFGALTDFLCYSSSLSSFCATFSPLPISPSPWLYHPAKCIVNWMFQKAESAMQLESCVWCLERCSESLRSQWSSTKMLTAGILWHRCIHDDVGCFLFFFSFLLATRFNCVLVVSVIHTQFIAA